MDDLKQRFRTLDQIPVPDLWGEIGTRFASRTSPVSGLIRPGSVAASGLWLAWILLALLMTALIGAALMVGALSLDGHQITVAPPSIRPSSVATGITNSSTVPETACASREAPADLRVVPVSLPADPADMVESACRVWIRLGSNGAGIVRMDPAASAVDARIAPDEITVIVDTSDRTLWAEAGPSVIDPGALSSLGTIDPVSATWRPLRQVPGNHSQSGIVGDVIWLREWRSERTWLIRLGDDPGVAPREISVPRGQLSAAFGSMWVFARGTPSALMRFDPADQRLLATIEVGTSVSCIETTHGFACTSDDGHLTGVSASTNKVEWSVAIPGPLTEFPNVAALGGSVWLQPTRSAPGRVDAEELIEIDLATGEVRRRLPFAVRQPNGFWGTGGSLWVMSEDPGMVRVDLPAGG